MENQVEIFKPGIAELKGMADKFAGLSINGINDDHGYSLVKDAQKELASTRIMITKFGKEKRDDALKFQREVIRQEKELLEIIAPIEDKLKEQMKVVDEARKMAERSHLLPSRKKMLSEIDVNLSDEEILQMDEKQFSSFYNDQIAAFNERLESERIKKEEAEAQEKKLQEAKAEAAAKAVEEERERVKAAEDLKKKEEETRLENERIEAEKIEKNKRYQNWLQENGVTKETKDDFFLNTVGNTVTLFKKVSEINI